MEKSRIIIMNNVYFCCIRIFYNAHNVHNGHRFLHHCVRDGDGDGFDDKYHGNDSLELLVIELWEGIYKNEGKRQIGIHAFHFFITNRATRFVFFPKSIGNFILWLRKTNDSISIFLNERGIWLPTITIIIIIITQYLNGCGIRTVKSSERSISQNCLNGTRFQWIV